MKRALITGIDGFIGQFLCAYLLQKGYKVFGISRNKEDENIFVADIRHKKKIFDIIKKVRPNEVYHLAAQSNIPLSVKSPAETLDINIFGTLNILQAAIENVPECTIVSLGSSSEYGRSAQDDHFLSEDAPLQPVTPYAMSKATQGELVGFFRHQHSLNAIHVRPFAILGPGKLGDAVSNFAENIVAIEEGKKEKLLVGDTNRIRDVMDVRDAIGAIHRIAIKGKEAVYNICTGKKIQLRKMLKTLVSRSHKQIIMKKDTSLLRTIDDQIIVGNPSRLVSLGFSPKISVEQTLIDILTYWRKERHA